MKERNYWRGGGGGGAEITEEGEEITGGGEEITGDLLVNMHALVVLAVTYIIVESCLMEACLFLFKHSYT